MSGEQDPIGPIEQGGRTAYEHLHRHAIYSEAVAEKTVLHLGCGSGYGTSLLAGVAQAITGMDSSLPAIRTAKQRHSRPNLTYRVGDYDKLPFDDATFDVIIADKIIEYAADPHIVVSEIRRVMAKDGVLLITAINRPVYNRYKKPDPYHVSELDVSELTELLQAHFRHVHLTGLRMALASVGYDLAGRSGSSNQPVAKLYSSGVSDLGMPLLEPAEIGLADPEYILATCSDQVMAAPPFPSSIFLSHQDDLWLEHEKVLAWASQLHEEDEGLRAELLSARAEVEAAQESSRKAADDVSALRQANEATQAFLNQKQQSLLEEAEAARRENAAQLSTTARLLTRLDGSGERIDADPTAIIEALFTLNERILTQKNQIAQLMAVESQLAELHVRLNTQTAELSARSLALAEAQIGIAHRDGQIEAGKNALNLREQEFEILRKDRDQEASLNQATRAELEQSHQRITQLLFELEGKTTLLGEMSARQIELEEETRGVLAVRERDLANTKAKLHHAAAMAEDRAAQLSRLQDNLGALQEKASAEERKRSALENEIATLKEQIRVAKQSVQAIQAAVVPARNTETPNALLSAPSAAENGRNPRRQIAAVQTRVQNSLREASSKVAGRIPSKAPSPPKAWHTKLIAQITPTAADTPVFDRVWIQRNHPELSGINWKAYITDPRYHRVSPHPLFDADYYLTQNRDVAAAGHNPLRHYLDHGWREGRNPHPLFANDWYLARNPDVLDAEVNPLEHYLKNGWQEGRCPNPLFDPRAYRDRYHDVDVAGIEPLSHYVAYGREEGREVPIRAVSPEWAQLIPDDARQKDMMEFLLGIEKGRIDDFIPNEPGAVQDARHTPPPQPVPTVPQSGPADPVSAPEWPPERLDDYWLPQTLRDFIIDGYGEEIVNLYWYLCSVMNKYQDDQESFMTSEACRILVARAQVLASRGTSSYGDIDVTVIIPVYNNVLDTLLCLLTVLETSDGRAYEIIVADDGSSDATSRIIPAIGGLVRYCRQPKNLGFLGNCNSAARQARGTHIVLLNNDTLVMPHWLDKLLSPFEKLPNIGLTGSKLINWDGNLQEAGGIFWDDGSAWNFGRNQEARSPEFSYLKDVDYVSGASIAIPRTLWEKLDGFDPRYTPAYCEDSDIAFRIREAGYRTILQPASEVVHHEGRSHGRDVNSGIKAYQIANQQRLLERWGDTLARDHYPNAQNVLRARDRSRNKKHALVVDHYVPQWDKDAGSKTIYRFLHALLSEGWSVTFWPDNLYHDRHYASELQELGVEVIYGPRFVGKFEQFLSDRSDLYDAVLLSRPHISVHYIDGVRRLSKAKIVYYGHDIHFERMKAGRSHLGDDLASDAAIANMRELELGICGKSDVALYPSDTEADFIRALVPDTVCSSIPAYSFSSQELVVSRNLLASRTPQDKLDLLFVGGFSHHPNVDGIMWFVEEVVPLLRANGRPFSLKIVGSNPTPQIWALAEEGVEVLGFVSDERLTELYREATLVIAPLRYGAGVKGKVVEAMARGVPVVTTDTGGQGIADYPEKLFIGNSPLEFAEAIEAASNHDRAIARARIALDYISDNYSDLRLQKTLSQLMI